VASSSTAVQAARAAHEPEDACFETRDGRLKSMVFIGCE